MKIGIIGAVALALSIACTLAFAQQDAAFVKNFVDSVQTKEHKIDINVFKDNFDSIEYNHGYAAAMDFLIDMAIEAYKRPVKVQVDTININNCSDFAKHKTGAEFHIHLNNITLYYSLIDSTFRRSVDKNEDPACAANLERADHGNRDMDIAYIHEFKHSKNHVNFFLWDSISAVQLFQINFHSEVSAFVAEMLYQRELFLKNKNLGDAFRDEYIPARRDLAKENVNEFFPSVWRDPFSGNWDYKGLEKDFDSDDEIERFVAKNEAKDKRIYRAYLQEHPNIGSEPDAYESKIILYAALRRLNADRVGYVKQFVNSVMSNRTKIKYYLKRSNTKGKLSFDEQVQKSYDFVINGEKFNLLNAVGETGKAKLFSESSSWIPESFEKLMRMFY